jgi:trimeric autotransporter adhesin
MRIVICYFVLFSVLSNAQIYLNVRFSDGSSQSSQLGSVNKINFTDNGKQIYIYHSSLGLVSKSTGSIQKFTFGQSQTGGLLPVKLAVFTATVNGMSVLLSWQTITEVSSAFFQIEISAGAGWVKVCELKAAGLSNSPKYYSYSDKNLLPGKYSYRLKMIDADGTFKFSNIVNVDLSIPAAFALSQNYPNPFNPSTKINYQIPQTGKVSIVVYNVNGTEIRNLFNGLQEPGNYNIAWDGRNNSGNPVASGFYMYSVKHNTSVLNKKMLLIK